MGTVWVTVELVLPRDVGAIPDLIERSLQQWGDPLRWAITSIDPTTRLAQIEAIVTTQPSADIQPSA